MSTPFPGMDPYLEKASIWPDVHHGLIGAIRDNLSPRLAPRYYVAVETRAYLMRPDLDLMITRPDIAIVPHAALSAPGRLPLADMDVLDVEVPVLEEVRERYLEVREVGTHRVITVLELLSPTNKAPGRGRDEYEAKRAEILNSRASLVEIDLLRAGEPMPLVSRPAASAYRILVARGHRRPGAQLYAFGVRQPIPAIPLPLARGEDEPLVELNAILHALYERARFDLRLDYNQPPAPPLSDEDAEWARTLNARNP